MNYFEQNVSCDQKMLLFKNLIEKLYYLISSLAKHRTSPLDTYQNDQNLQTHQTFKHRNQPLLLRVTELIAYI